MKLVRTRQNTLMWIVDVLLTLLAWGGLIWLLARGISAMLETHGGPRIEAPILRRSTPCRFTCGSRCSMR